MKIQEILSVLEAYAHPSMQESYDNAGLITGHTGQDCTGVLCTLDCTEEVIEEAIQKSCNLVVAHHPIVFKGLKQLNGKNYVERAVIRAIKNDIAIYAIHTNLDNAWNGVNHKIAQKLGVKPLQVLQPMGRQLLKLYTYVPHNEVENVKNALFAAGAGTIGNYRECSFSVKGEGTFTAGDDAEPYVGKTGVRHTEPETRLEVLLPVHQKNAVLKALQEAHPYEEVAYELVQLENMHPYAGAGLLTELSEDVDPEEFLKMVKTNMQVPCIKHTARPHKKIKRVAVCGGAGSFLINNALRAKADVYITSDLKYHEFFDAEDRLWLLDIGHYESEQYTTELLFEILHKKFPTFAVLKASIQTNPVQYYF